MEPDGPGSAPVLELPLPADHRLQQLDRPDLGAFVAMMLADPAAYAGRRFELASDAPMWEFLRGPGYQADIAALRRDYPAVGWTLFTEWAQRTLRPGA